MLQNLVIIVSLLLANINLNVSTTKDQTPATNVAKIPSKLPQIRDESDKWQKLSKHLVQMMVGADKGRIDVTILLAGSARSTYAELYKTIERHSDIKLVTTTFAMGKDLSAVKLRDAYKDYFIILIDEYTIFAKFINDYFSLIFVNKSIKIFVILRFNRSTRNAVDVWSALRLQKYYNVYVLLHQSSGTFDAFRTALRKVGHMQVDITLLKAEENKFLMMKDIIKGDVMSKLRIVFFNSYPVSYENNGVIIGADGNLIQEFSKQLGTSYQIINKDKSRPTSEKIFYYLESDGDISLYTQLNILRPNVQSIYLNQMDGLCLLTPRNIPIAVRGGFAIPIDSVSILMTFISTVSVIVCWKLITIDLSLTSIVFATFELVLNLGSSSADKLTLRENILVYSFIVSSFFLVNMYESTTISYKFGDTTWRSAESIEELNDRNTKFHSYYNEKVVEQSRLPIIRPDLILSFIDVSNNLNLNIPEDLDANLVYILNCDYADHFIMSSRNYHNGRQLFDKMTITQTYKTYNVNSGYFFIDKFKAFFEKLMESGIYDFWKSINSVDQERHKIGCGQNESELTEYADMIVPASLLGIGCLIGLLVLLNELLLHILMSDRIEYKNRNPVKKPKLHKWIQKYIFSRKDKLDNANAFHQIKSIIKAYKVAQKQNFKCRETVNGGYFVKKRFRINRQSEQLVILPGTQFIQVRPYSSN